MADDKSKQYKDAMKQLDALVKKQEALNKSTEALKTSWGAISSEIFKLDGAAWFKKVPLAAEDVKKINEEIKKVTEQVKVLENAFDDALDADEKFKGLKESSQTYFNDYQKNLSNLKSQNLSDTQAELEAKKMMFDQFKADYNDLSELSNEEIENIIASTKAGYKLSEIFDDLSEESKKLLISSSDNADEMMRFQIEATKAKAPLVELNKKLADGVKETLDLGGAMQKFTMNIVKEGFSALKAFDQQLTDTQRATGINMHDNAAAFGDLTGEVAQFGMSVKGAGEMMGAMSDELNTTNFSLLSQATKDFAAIEGATGASAKEITTISGELMRMGKSSADVKDYFEDAGKMARSFGVSSKKAVEGISRNLTKMRTMGFVGGEKSLAKMVITAEKLNMNVDEIFDVAKRARTIEGAMEMASELQLAGGSFANINPMDLLAAARKGPAELQKILTSMGKDVGRFNKETGEYEFDPVDIDRLQMVADATGQSLDSITKGIQKGGLDKEKLDPFSGMLGGLDEADKALGESTLGEMMKWNKDKGKFELDADSSMAKKMGIESMEELQNMSSADLKKKLDAQAKEKETIEETNKRNQSFQESLTNFWSALSSIFSVFEPILHGLTTVLQTVSKWVGMLPGWGKWIVGSLMIAFGLFGTSVGAFITKGIGAFLKAPMNMVNKVKGMFGGGDDDRGFKPRSYGKKSLTETASPKAGAGDGLKSLAEGLGAMGTTAGVMKGILAVALAGPAFLLFVPALPGLMIMALVGTVSGSVIKGFEAIALGLAAFGNTKGIYEGIGALALAAIPLAIFGPLSLLLLPLAIIGMLAKPIENGFGAIGRGVGLMGSNLTNIAKGALAMFIIGLSLIPFAYALSMMTDVSWEGVGAALVFLLAAVGTLLLLGFLMSSGVGAVALVLGAAAILIIAGAFLVFALAMQQMIPVVAAMQGADFGWLFNMGMALLGAAPGLLLGGLALIVATPGLIIGSMGIKALSDAALIATAVDWGVISNMGNALMSAVPGLLLFGLSAILFANPLTLLGIFAMTYALSGLVEVMTPLASALTLGSGSLNSFASGLDRLAMAADALSDDKLEKLQKISEAMASASAAGNVANVMTAVAGGGGGAGGGDARKIEIDIKLNGRDVQYQIVKDTAVHK